METPGPPTGGQSPRAFAAKEGKEVLFSAGKELGKAFWTANCWEVPQGSEVRIIHLSETKGWIYSPAQGSPWLGGGYQDTPLHGPSLLGYVCSLTLNTLLTWQDMTVELWDGDTLCEMPPMGPSLNHCSSQPTWGSPASLPSVQSWTGIAGYWITDLEFQGIELQGWDFRVLDYRSGIAGYWIIDLEFQGIGLQVPRVLPQPQ